MAPVLLFDGSCTFCSGAVRFVLERERSSELHFGSLQSEGARELLAHHGVPDSATTGADGAPSTMVLIEDGKVYTHSTGALRVARYLRAPWRWASLFAVVPRSVRDACYRWFAAHRYRWFGRDEACMVPSPELRARFLQS